MVRRSVLPLLVFLCAGCTVDEFVSTGTANQTLDDAGDAATTIPDASTTPPDASATVDAAPPPPFCDLQGGDDAGRALVGCADFDHPSPFGFTIVDQGKGTIVIENAGSPSAPNHFHAMLPAASTTGSGVKQAQASVPLASTIVLEATMRVGANPLGPNQVVTYVSMTPNGNEAALGAFHLVRTGSTFRLASTGGNPPIKDLAAMSVLASGWHRVQVVYTRTPMTYQVSLDGVLLATVGGFAIQDPTNLVARVGAWNTVMQPGEPADDARFDDVVVRE